MSGEKGGIESHFGGPDFRLSQTASLGQTNPSAIQQYYQQIS